MKFYTVWKSILLLLCLNVLSENASANVLKLIIPSILVKQHASGPHWRSPQLIETDNAGNAIFPGVVFDSNGNAFAAWVQSDGTSYNFWANRYDAVTGWGTPQLIENDVLGGTIAFDSNGNAFAVWSKSDGTSYNVWAKHYDAVTGWGTPQLIENNTGDAYAGPIAFDSNGNALTVWMQSDGTSYNIWANRYVAGSGWGTAELIENNTGDTNVSSSIAFDSNGNALTVWMQSDGTSYNIWANRYVAGSGWDTAELIENNTGDTRGPVIAVDSSGNAIAVWQQSDGTRDNIWANRYVAGSGWKTAQLIETDNAGMATRPQIAFDNAGNAVAVWEQDDNSLNGMNIYASRYDAVTGWGTPQVRTC